MAIFGRIGLERDHRQVVPEQPHRLDGRAAVCADIKIDGAFGVSKMTEDGEIGLDRPPQSLVDAAPQIRLDAKPAHDRGIRGGDQGIMPHSTSLQARTDRKRDIRKGYHSILYPR